MVYVKRNICKLETKSHIIDSFMGRLVMKHNYRDIYINVFFILPHPKVGESEYGRDGR